MADRWPMIVGTLIVLLGLWMVRFEMVGDAHIMHRNRITGAVCPVGQECWFSSFYPASKAP